MFLSQILKKTPEQFESGVERPSDNFWWIKDHLIQGKVARNRLKLLLVLHTHVRDMAPFFKWYESTVSHFLGFIKAMKADIMICFSENTVLTSNR